MDLVTLKEGFLSENRRAWPEENILKLQIMAQRFAYLLRSGWSLVEIEAMDESDAVALQSPPEDW